MADCRVFGVIGAVWCNQSAEVWWCNRPAEVWWCNWLTYITKLFKRGAIGPLFFFFWDGAKGSNLKKN